MRGQYRLGRAPEPVRAIATAWSVERVPQLPERPVEASLHHGLRFPGELRDLAELQVGSVPERDHIALGRRKDAHGAPHLVTSRDRIDRDIGLEGIWGAHLRQRPRFCGLAATPGAQGV